MYTWYCKHDKCPVAFYTHSTTLLYIMSLSITIYFLGIIVTIEEKLDTWYTLIRNVVIIQYILYKGTSTLNMYQARERLKVNFTYNHLRSWHTIYRLHEPNNVIRCEKNLIWPVMIKHYAWNRILFFWFSIA